MSDRRTIEEFQRAHSAEHQGPAILRANTAPASYGHVLPIAPVRQMLVSVPNETNTISEPTHLIEPQGSEAEPWVRTMHVHPPTNPPDLTELCRCLLDTGSDFNLVSERLLGELGLPLTHSEHERPILMGLGGARILPIGSVVLTWHMDCKKLINYSDIFWVISDDTPALFDVLIGKNWIKKYKALLRNPAVMLARPIGLDSSHNSTLGGC
jgi:hypothetical protein